MHVRLKVALAGVVLLTSAVSAGQPARRGTVQPAATAAQVPSRDIRATINGIALDGDRKALPQARLRLRNLDVNAVEQSTTSDARGEFSFGVRPEIPYVVEVADTSGRVIAVGDVVVPRSGEVARIVILLPSRLPATSSMFAQTATTVVAAAASIGIAVVDPTLPKVSPTR